MRVLPFEEEKNQIQNEDSDGEENEEEDN